MRLSNQYKAAFVKAGFHALVVIGAPHRIHIQTDEQHARMWEWIASGIGPNGPPAPEQLVTSRWLQRVVVTSDTTMKPVGRIDGEQPAWTVEILGRVWSSYDGAQLLMDIYAKHKGGFIRKHWLDGGVPVDRMTLDYELKCLAADHNITALMDDQMMEVLDDLVFRRQTRQEEAVHG